MSKIKKGITFIILVITIFVSGISCSTKVITGKYRTNFNTYGMFSKSLTLDCNGIATMNFQGDMQNNNSYGTWKKDKDTLVIFFDSLLNKNNRYKGEIKFLIKRNRLENMPYPKSLYREFVKDYKTNKMDLKEFPSYKKLNQTPKDWKGKMGNQYFKKIEKTDCAK
ncbi:MAG: hypothetical protein V4666_12090 [Bacteroidota bacterium]